MPTTHTLKIAGETYTGVDTLQMKGANSEEGKIIEYVAAEWETLSFNDDSTASILGTHKPSTGKDGFSQVTIESNNLISKNIRKGVTIFGVQGIYAPSYSLQGTWDFPTDSAAMYDALSNIDQNINFKVVIYRTADKKFDEDGLYYGPFTGFSCTGSRAGLYYKTSSGTRLAFSGYQASWQTWDDDDRPTGYPCRIIFGDTPQTVSEQFYAWFVETATQVSGGGGGGSEDVSIETGTLNLSIDYCQGVYIPVLNNGSITYSAGTNGNTTINNVVLNAPFTVLYGKGQSYSIDDPVLSNVTQFHNYVPADHNYCSFVGILTKASGSVYVTVNCCFEGSSQVLLANGTTKTLSTIEIGDTVLTYNETTKEIEANEVTALGTVDLIHMAQLTLEDTTVIRMNRYHPMWTQDGWKSLTGHNGLPMLTANDKLMNNNGEYIAIKSIEIVNIEKETYYTLKVANNNNFYVNGYLAQGKDKD